MKYFLPLAAICLLLSACFLKTDDKSTGNIELDFSDVTLQRIYTYQDKQLSDSLFYYFRHKNPNYRYAAALAFASLQTPTAIDSLAFLLKDKSANVRTAAAYAIGQIGKPAGEDVLIDAFERFDSTGIYRQFNGAILEAIGKCGSHKQLKNLATISTYKYTDTLLLRSQALGIYRYALRDTISPEGTKKMLEFAVNPQYSDAVRLVAANYLYRAKNIVIDSSGLGLVDATLREKKPFIRMPLVIALGKTKWDIARNTLINLYRTETDYRVKCNILRALSNFNYADVKVIALEGILDKNSHVAYTAAQYLRDNGVNEDVYLYRQQAKTETRWQVKTMLLEAALKCSNPYYFDTKTGISNDLWQVFDNSKNNYEKAAALQALGNYAWNYKTIRDKSFKSDVAVIRTSGIEAISNILKSPNFSTTLQLSTKRARQEMNSYLKEALASGDPALVGVAAITARTPELGFKQFWADSTFVEDAQKKLVLPRDIETYNEVVQTINFLRENQKNFTPLEIKKLPYNHPIDWNIINAYKKSNQAIISTKAGNISIELFPEKAPGSVANFTKLAKDGFYNDKVIHRVVPNHVIQGGCPRGDGWGSLDYSIRSEFNFNYYDDEGYLGMASSGNNTEGTQWFITHCPTLHLDGKYTIFGKVTKGMDIVHLIEIGDRIISVEVR